MKFAMNLQSFLWTFTLGILCVLMALIFTM